MTTPPISPAPEGTEATVPDEIAEIEKLAERYYVCEAIDHPNGIVPPTAQELGDALGTAIAHVKRITEERDAKDKLFRLQIRACDAMEKERDEIYAAYVAAKAERDEAVERLKPFKKWYDADPSRPDEAIPTNWLMPCVGDLRRAAKHGGKG